MFRQLKAILGMGSKSPEDPPAEAAPAEAAPTAAAAPIAEAGSKQPAAAPEEAPDGSAETAAEADAEGGEPKKKRRRSLPKRGNYKRPEERATIVPGAMNVADFKKKDG